MRKGKVEGGEDLEFMENEAGKFAFKYLHYDKEHRYETDFLYDSMKVLSRYHVRVGRKDDSGVEKYGVICTKHLAKGYIVPCLFDKIKLYDGTDLIAEREGRKYIIDCDGGIMAWKIYDLRKKYE